MNKSKLSFILFLNITIVWLAHLGAPVAQAQAGDNGIISGTAWVDANGNGSQEPAEEVASSVTIEVRASDRTLAATAITDKSGFYIISGLAYGIYSVSAIEQDGAITSEQTVELNEVNGTAVVDIAMKAPIMKFQFLPLVRR
ncbi:MAG: hypothetical protein KDE54_00690 [Caldilineaceae bacterium]|nr:hypothetical protein [Caldilineaceae bacterium]MCB0096311.1 hypothetical protein [Caldilineaceae bacterium]MCB0138882.1 hypothetical protein [Caldilineaceae bacterium]